jgi:Lon protease-like protein
MSATVVTFDDLPATLPVFPLSGVLLLPRGSLPLNIFEPRYRNMTADALASDRLIGMVQPMAPEEIPVTPTGEIKNLDRERLPL